MLPAPFRLRLRKDILATLKQGRQKHSSYLILYFLPADNLKVGFVVSQKVSKKAVERNRLKRRLREIIRREWLYRLMPGYYLFVAKKGASELSFEDLKKEVSDLLLDEDI